MKLRVSIVLQQTSAAGPLEEILFNQTQTHKQGEEKEIKNNKEKDEKDEKEQETGKGTSERLEENLNSHLKSDIICSQDKMPAIQTLYITYKR